MKKYFLMTAMSILLAGAVFAQEAQGNLNNESKSAAASPNIAGTVTSLLCNQAQILIASPHNDLVTPFKVGRFTAAGYQVPYTGGNGGEIAPFPSVSTPQMLGLTLEGPVNPSYLSIGNASWHPIITGTPTAAGIAYFPITIGNKTCTLAITVVP
jgi:hypothetical protein